MYDEYIAEASIVIPRYLIVLQKKQFRKVKSIYKDKVPILLFCVLTLVFFSFFFVKTN